MSGKYYALKLSLLILVSLAFGFALAYLWARREAVSADRQPSIARLDSDKAQDGLAGAVHQVRSETARLSDKSGQLVEGPRQLMELALYDQKGQRVERASYLTSGNSYNGRQEYEYDDKGNITGMTARGEDNSVMGREVYKYEFDAMGNWTKMTASRATGEADKESAKPYEVTYRSITYYYDKNLAGIMERNSSSEDGSGPSSASTNEAVRSKEELPETFFALRRALDEWIQANNARDVEKELSFYGAKLLFYYRSRNVSRDTVRKDKAAMFERAELIDVRAGAPEINLDKDGQTANMRFRKQYIVRIRGSEIYGDVIQELRWQRTDGGWLIIGERQLQEAR